MQAQIDLTVDPRTSVWTTLDFNVRVIFHFKADGSALLFQQKQLKKKRSAYDLFWRSYPEVVFHLFASMLSVTSGIPIYIPNFLQHFPPFSGCL